VVAGCSLNQSSTPPVTIAASCQSPPLRLPFPASRIATRKQLLRDEDVTESFADNVDVAVGFKLRSRQVRPPEHFHLRPLAHYPNPGAQRRARIRTSDPRSSGQFTVPNSRRSTWAKRSARLAVIRPSRATPSQSAPTNARRGSLCRALRCKDPP
jgi:hypothetical protein